MVSMVTYACIRTLRSKEKAQGSVDAARIDVRTKRIALHTARLYIAQPRLPCGVKITMRIDVDVLTRITPDRNVSATRRDETRRDTSIQFHPVNRPPFAYLLPSLFLLTREIR